MVKIESELFYAIKSRLPERGKDLRSRVTEFPLKPTQWIEPPSYREEQLAKNLVSLPELYKHALIEQNPIALKTVEGRESDYQSESNQFEESSRTAYWSVMVSLLTIIDLSLGSKAKGTVLWIIIEKLKQHPLVALALASGYVFAVVVPLVNSSEQIWKTGVRAK